MSLDKYGKHFMDGDCYRESCYQCLFANINRVGDITIGDFWGVAKCHPEFFSEKGVSCVLVNTEKGVLLFNEMKEMAFILKISLDQALLKQHNLISPSLRPKNRDIFYKNLEDANFIEKIKIGVQLKNRIKDILPPKFLIILKNILNN